MKNRSFIVMLFLIGLLLMLQSGSLCQARQIDGFFDFQFESSEGPAPEMSADGMTVYHAVPRAVVMADPKPGPDRIRKSVSERLTDPSTASASFEVTYVPDGGEDPWGERCYAFPEDAKAAVDMAATIWGNTLHSTVPITVRACWASLSGGTLGYSGGQPQHRDFPGNTRPGTWFQASLANSLAGEDLDPDSFDMHISMNRNFSWYLGLDGNPPSGEYDFVSVMLHEIAHGLNFSGTMQYQGGWAGWGRGTGYPNIYDVFMHDDQENQLIDTSVYPNPSQALGDAVTSNDMWFLGSQAMEGNNGQQVKMYAPYTWAPGSSYSHLDYATFSGTLNRLMVYAISSGDAIHDPGPVTNGLLRDLSWQMDDDPGLVVDPESMSVNVNLGQSINMPLTVTNPGQQSVDFAIQKRPATQPLRLSASQITATDDSRQQQGLGTEMSEVDSAGMVITRSKQELTPSHVSQSDISILVFKPYVDVPDRLAELGYTVTTTTSSSDLNRSNLQNFDLLWISVDTHPDLYAAQNADIRDWVNHDGGGLIVNQPNYSSVNVSVFPAGFEVFINSTWWPGDPNTTITNVAHPITQGLQDEDLSGNFDWVRGEDIGEQWDILAVDVQTPTDVAMIAGEYGMGRFVFNTHNFCSLSMIPGSDIYIIQMIDWAGNGGAAWVPWLDMEPKSGTIEPGASQTVTVTFDAGVEEITGPGVYQAWLDVVNNTTQEIISVPVTMNVISGVSPGVLMLLLDEE